MNYSSVPTATWVTLALVLGLLVGSFINVVIVRLPRRLEAQWRADAREVLGIETPPEEATLPPGIVREPSHCPQCLHRLSVTDNVPLFSWLWLRGRCRYCKAPISVQYPCVEALTALASAVVVWRFGVGVPGLVALVFTWVLIAAAGIDLRTQLLPDQLTLPLLWLGLLLSMTSMTVPPAAAILGAAAGYLSLWSVYWAFRLLTGKEGMGYGDFKLLGGLGAWMGAWAVLPVVLISSLIGALVGGALIALRRHQREVPIPFGPFIAAAGWVWFVAGDVLARAYLHWTGMR